METEDSFWEDSERYYGLLARETMNGEDTDVNEKKGNRLKDV